MRKLDVTDAEFRDLENAPTVEHVVLWTTGNANPPLRPFLAGVHRGP